MKMLPIVFQSVYSNDLLIDGYEHGFTPFFNEQNEKVTERIVEIEPTTWVQGFALRVRVLQKVCPFNHKPRIEKLVETWIYDRPESSDDFIHPTTEQTLLIGALHNGEIRGRYADNIVTNLYIDLVVLNPKFKLDLYLPEVVEFWRKHYDKYGFTIKSK